jgi:hypothetical protein
MAEKFVAARSLITTQPQQALAVCNELLMSLPHDTSQDMEGGIRVGDVYALMVSTHQQHAASMATVFLLLPALPRDMHTACSRPHQSDQSFHDVLT